MTPDEGRGIEEEQPGQGGQGPPSQPGGNAPAPPPAQPGSSGPEAPAPAPQPSTFPPSPAAQPPAPPAPTASGGPFAIKRSVLRAIGFTLLSFGLYHFYWFNVTRKEVSRELGTDDDAALQTAGLLVPILNWIIIYWLWRDINVARTRVGLPEFSLPVYLVLSILGLAPIFYCLVASSLNEYWDRRTGGQATDAPVTRNEKLVVALGALLWLLWALIVVVIIVVAATTS